MLPGRARIIGPAYASFPVVRRLSTWFPPRQGTIEGRDPSSVTKAGVLALLHSQFRPSKKIRSQFSKRSIGTPFLSDNQAIVILATPSYSDWLEDDVSFIPKLLEIITHRSEDGLSSQAGSTRSQGSNGLPFEIDVLCACVDSISPKSDWLHDTRGRHSREGFSFLHGPSNQILPNLWGVESSTTENSPSMQSSLTFWSTQKVSGKVNDQKKIPTSEITLPLANTLFKNGRHSTLLASKWQPQEGDSFKKVKDVEKRNQIINAMENEPPGIPSSSIPALPLTPARRIVSGLGNIVRQLHFDDGPGPASRELEANITEYLKVTNMPNSAIGIWALITPLKSLPKLPYGPPFDPTIDQSVVNTFWLKPNPDSDFVDQWIEEGASFCRVLSGGGGWGSKQGLLSLDPQTTYSTTNEARFDYSIGSLQEQQAMALGDIAKPNSFIQFFVAAGPSTFLIKKNHGEITAHTNDVFRSNIVIGVYPSTVDEVPKLPTNKPQTKKNLRFRAGHFGAMSEAGMYLKISKVDDKGSGESITSTKIDLPYSYFYSVHPQTEPKVKKAPEIPPASVRRVTCSHNFRKVHVL